METVLLAYTVGLVIFLATWTTFQLVDLYFDVKYLKQDVARLHAELAEARRITRSNEYISIKRGQQ
jgi:hypothetical protein